MALEELLELANKVKGFKAELSDQNKKAEDLLNEYSKNVLCVGKPENHDTVKDIKSELYVLNADLKSLQEKASEKVAIAFIGAINSGKSSLINALLRDDRLPVAHGETTMCAVKISTTVDDKWKVHLDGKELTAKNEEEVKVLLSMMCGEVKEKERSNLRIDAHSTVQIDWPKNLCKRLPENIDLYDTPGFSDETEFEKAVEQCCRKADIIVAVMDVSSPALKEVTELVNKVNCQYTFGVFTKWDQFMEKNKHHSRVNEEQLQSMYKGKYLEKVDKGVKEKKKEQGQGKKQGNQRGSEAMRQEEGKGHGESHRQKEGNGDERLRTQEQRRKRTEEKGEDGEGNEDEEEEGKVFFVDVGSMEDNSLTFAGYKEEPSTEKKQERDGTKSTKSKGAEGFLKFEKMLGKSAKDLKGNILIWQAKAVVSKFQAALKNFQCIIEKRRKDSKASLDKLESNINTTKEDLLSLGVLRENVKSLEDLVSNFLTDEKIDDLIEELGNDIKDCSAEVEDELLLDFFKKVMREITDSLATETAKTNDEYRKWKDGLTSKYHLKESLPGYDQVELPEDCGNLSDCYQGIDPYNLVTDNFVWGIFVGSAVAVAAGVVVPTVGLGVAAVTALETAQVAAAGQVVSGAAGTTALLASVGFSKLLDGFGMGVGSKIRSLFGMSKNKIKATKHYARNVLKKFRKTIAERKGAPLEELEKISERILSAIAKVKGDSSEDISKLTEELKQLSEWANSLSDSIDRLLVVRGELEKLELELTSTKTVSSDDGTENQSPAECTS